MMVTVAHFMFMFVILMLLYIISYTNSMQTNSSESYVAGTDATAISEKVIKITDILQNLMFAFGGPGGPGGGRGGM